MASRFKHTGPRTYLRLLALFLATGPLLATTGCFSLGLGERTTYIQETPETLQRIASLETRLQVVEQTFRSQPETLYPQTGMPEALPAPIYPSTLPAEQ